MKLIFHSATAVSPLVIKKYSCSVILGNISKDLIENYSIVNTACRYFFGTMKIYYLNGVLIENNNFTKKLLTSP